MAPLAGRLCSHVRHLLRGCGPQETKQGEGLPLRERGAPGGQQLPALCYGGPGPAGSSGAALGLGLHIWKMGVHASHCRKLGLGGHAVGGVRPGLQGQLWPQRTGGWDVLALLGEARAVGKKQPIKIPVDKQVLPAAASQPSLQPRGAVWPAAHTGHTGKPGAPGVQLTEQKGREVSRAVVAQPGGPQGGSKQLGRWPPSASTAGPAHARTTGGPGKSPTHVSVTQCPSAPPCRTQKRHSPLCLWSPRCPRDSKHRPLWGGLTPPLPQ